MFIEHIIQGVNTDLDTADGFKTVWNYQSANLTNMTAGDTLDISSSSGNDVAAGTGARAVTLIGLDTNGNPITEGVTQSGTWRSSNTFYDFIGAYVSGAGTSLVNEGDIQIYGTGSGTRFGWIGTGLGRTQQAHYTVRTDYVAKITEIICENPYDAGGAAIVDFRLFIFDGTAKRELRRWRMDYSNGVDKVLDFSDNPIELEAGYSWWIEADTDTDNTTVVVSVKQRLERIQ